MRVEPIRTFLLRGVEQVDVAFRGDLDAAVAQRRRDRMQRLACLV